MQALLTKNTLSNFIIWRPLADTRFYKHEIIETIYHLLTIRKKCAMFCVNGIEVARHPLEHIAYFVNGPERYLIKGRFTDLSFYKKYNGVVSIKIELPDEFETIDRLDFNQLNK